MPQQRRFEREPGAGGDLAHAQACRLQQPHRDFHPLALQVAVRRDAVDQREQSQEVELGQAGDARQRRQADFARIVRV